MTLRASNPVKLVRFEDGNGREWWQIAVRGPWWWPFWRYVCELRMAFGTAFTGPAEFTTREEAEKAIRLVRDRLRQANVRKVEEIQS